MDIRGTEHLPVPALRLKQKQKAARKFRNSSHQPKANSAQGMRTSRGKLRNKHPDPLAGRCNGGYPGPEGRDACGRHTRPRPELLRRCPTAPCSAWRSSTASRPLAAVGGKGGSWLHAHLHLRPLPGTPRRRPASPAQPRSPTGTESREGPAPRTSGNAIGRKASRVPPRAGRGGLPRLAARPRPRPRPGSVPGRFSRLGLRPRNASRKSD